MANFEVFHISLTINFLFLNCALSHYIRLDSNHIVLEALLSCIIIHERDGILKYGSEEMKSFFKILIDGSPIGLEKTKQYSLEQIFSKINLK